MIFQLMRWSALVLLVCAASSLADVVTLNITRMTWSYTRENPLPGNEEKTSLTVCTDAVLLAEVDDIIRLAVGTSDGEKTFQGTLGTESNCALFSEGEPLPLPSDEVAVYKLTVSNSTGVESSSGSVSFAYPVTASEIIDCGGTRIVRLALTGTAPEPTNCFQGSGLTSTLCYVDVDPSEASTVCILGLDVNSGVEVCQANIPDTEATDLDPGELTAKYISYGATDASLGVSHDLTDPIALTELLSRVGDDGSVAVHSCTGDICELNPFLTSTNNYELCGVFTDSNTASVTHVGTATFQDLKLTVDSTTPTVDFHFYNVEQISYNVYEDPDLSNPVSSFTLDCTHISAESYCNGFILPDVDGNFPATIAVSFTNVTNVVAIPVASSSREPEEAVASRAAGHEKDAVDLQTSM